MKKLILSATLLSLSLCSYAQTQIGNSGFENWDNIGTDNVEPTNWNSFKSAYVPEGNFILGAAKVQQINRSSHKRPGSTGLYSAVIWSRSVLGIVANGNMTLGQIQIGNASATHSSNHNKSIISNTSYSEPLTEVPDSLVVWVKFKQAGSGVQKARVSSIIHSNADFRDPNDTTNTTLTRAKATRNFTSNGAVWQRISIPFVNLGTSAPAYILTTFTTNSSPGGGAANDSLYIDDLQLVYVPKASFTKSAASISCGSSVNFTSTSTNYPASYSWNFGDGSPASTSQNPSHTFANPGTYNVTLTATNQWGSTTSSVQVVTVTGPDASINYSQTSYCKSASNQVPTVVNSGVFSASPSGLSINPTTGIVDVSASLAGTYVISNAVTTTCLVTNTTNMTIVNVIDATLSYSATAYCPSEGNQSPTVTNSGTFTASPAGLSINASTGVVNLAASTAGTTYTVTNTTSGVCPDTKTASITVTAASNSSFAYASNTICTSAADQTPTIQTPGGTFTTSSTDISVDPSTGVIDMDNTTDGTYTITYAVGGTCPTTTNVSVTITAAPDATFTYGATSTFCTEGTDVLPVFTGSANGGEFTSSTGLSINPNSGLIDLSASTPGNYTVTNTIAASGTCVEDVKTTAITIEASPNAAFSYGSTAYCASEIDPTPTLAGVAGVFSSTNGLIINSNSGVIDLSASTAGTYVVTNTVTGTCSDVETTSITIHALPTVAVAAFNDICVYNDPITLTGATPAGGTYSGNGVSSGNFDPSSITAGTNVTITYTYLDLTTGCSNTATNTILVDGCLSIEENESLQLVAYPNPSTGKVFFSNISEAVSFTVIGIAGQVVADGTLTSNSNSVDLSSFENGMYVIQLTQNGAQQLIRIVKN